MAGKISVFGQKPAGLAVFKDEADHDDFSLKDYIGKAALFTVQGIEERKTRYGMKNAVKVDVVILDGQTAEEFKDVLIFQSVPVRQLTPFTGQQTVTMIGTYPNKQSGGEAIKLVEAVPEAIAAAEAYIAAH